MRVLIVLILMVSAFLFSYFITEKAITKLNQPIIEPIEDVSDYKNVQPTVNVIFKDKDNIIAVKGIFDENMASDFSRKVMTSTEDEILVYIDSPGGSVDSLDRMLQIMKVSEKKFICVSRMAASAAFMLFENCDKRYILVDGTLMGHNASLMLSGEITKVKSQLDYILEMLKRIETNVAKRLGISYKEYKSLVANEIWYGAEIAIKKSAADEITTAICTKELTEQIYEKTITNCNLFGGCETKTATLSECPLI
jgi:ATP-dependent protease ClpP protease subunit